MERAKQQREEQAGLRRRRQAKPFSVRPSDRAHPYDSATYAQAEACAKRAIKRLQGRERVRIRHLDGEVAAVHIDWRDRVVVDMTDFGGRFA